MFERLSRAITHIEKILKFSKDDHLGYITSCPTNLGTALNGKIRIKLPKLSKNKELLTEIADRFYINIKNLDNEQIYIQNFGILEVSNRRKIGKSEKDIV